ncbi:NAD-dependent epimerase/dehydratase family protein [Bacteroides pyogenes]|uniref:NAD-dependent epimerase/dehydratase family protein n=1 Tax=Bacteroides pyogenes TaxID=310300 RepID=UPI0011E43D88|nr:NAD-dependent epimerase/dehydratase family protein [Bacteroides pyogenes]TYK33761.1 NAD-dependent epimerase/dehydratase family protein [Bacteroides pyogenes]
MKKLLFTGGTGFLGRNIKPILDKTYEVTTIGISDENKIKANLASDIPQLFEYYDIVLHAAGKAHIYPKTEAERQAFYDINYTGTIHLCEALEKVGVPKAFIFISTLSVYGGDIHGNMDTEDSKPLLGDTPYADSKIKAELFLTEWCAKNNVKLGILRPSLLVGKGAPGNLGAMIHAIKTGRYLSIAGGRAKKSMLMADDIAYLVPLVAEKGGVYNICDDHNPSFGELENCIAKQLGKRLPISIPLWVAKCLALIGDLFSFFPINSSRLEKIVTSDTWSNEKAKKELGWHPMDVINNFEI